MTASTVPPPRTPRASRATMPPPVSMENILALARSFAAARGATEALAEDIKAVQRKALGGRLRALRNRVAEQAASEDTLRAAILARPDLFASPRTITVDGVRFGLRKRPGTISLADEAQTIGRLRARFPDRAEALIRVRESLDRGALRKLPAGELAQIGVTIANAADEVTIAAGRDNLDRVVAALLDDHAPAEAA